MKIAIIENYLVIFYWIHEYGLKTSTKRKRTVSNFKKEPRNFNPHLVIFAECLEWCPRCLIARKNSRFVFQINLNCCLRRINVGRYSTKIRLTHSTCVSFSFNFFEFAKQLFIIAWKCCNEICYFSAHNFSLRKKC